MILGPKMGVQKFWRSTCLALLKLSFFVSRFGYLFHGSNDGSRAAKGRPGAPLGCFRAASWPVLEVPGRLQDFQSLVILRKYIVDQFAL